MAQIHLKSLQKLYEAGALEEHLPDEALPVESPQEPSPNESGFPSWYTSSNYQEALLGAISVQDGQLFNRVVAQVSTLANSSEIFQGMLRRDRHRVFRAAVDLQDTEAIQSLVGLALEHGTDASFKTMLTREYQGVGSHFSALIKSGQLTTCEWILSELEQGHTNDRPKSIAACSAFKPSPEDYGTAFLVELSKGNGERASELLGQYQSRIQGEGTRLEEQEIVLQILSAQNFNVYHNACANDRVLMRGLVRVAKQHGGADLVSQMVRSQSYRGLRDAVSRDDKVTALLIVNVLGEEERVKALEHVPGSWEVFHHEGQRIKKDELLQEMGGANERWKIVMNGDAPHSSLQKQSPYKFSPKLYRQILPEIQAACFLEGQEKHAELVAYKLSVLFASSQEVDRYLKSYAEKWKEGEASFSVIAATDFEIPAQGLWDVVHWKGFIMREGPRAAASLRDAPQIEKVARVLEQNVPSTIRGVREIETFSSYDRGTENPQFALDASTHGIHESYFDAALDYMQAHGIPSDQMPDILIDGADIGHPEYYMVKLAVDDPMQCVLGVVNNHSVHVSNDAGKHTVPHIVQSQYAGAYVLKKKSGGAITGKDPIAADSWAYITEQNNIVFDGIGSKESSTSSDGAISRIDQVFHCFLERFAFYVVDKHVFSADSAYMRDDAETAAPELVRNDAQTVYIEGVRLGDDKAWEEHLGADAKQIDCARFGQFFNPQDKRPGWIHNESQDHQLLITPKAHRDGDTDKIEEPSDRYADLLEAEAKAYIERTVTRLRDEYGVVIQLGLELEAYAYDKDGIRRSKHIDVGAVNRSLSEAGLECRFEDENTDDYDGQYEAVLPPLPPMAAADLATAVREHLIDHADEFGLSHFDFRSVIEADEKNKAPIEASSTHLNFTLWSKDGKPLTKKSDTGNGRSVLTNVVTKGTLDVQRKLSVVFAQNAQDFERFGYMSPVKAERDPRHFAPTHIFAVTDWNRTYEGPSLGVWHSSKTIAPDHPETVRPENRMVGSGANYYVAIAGQLAAIEWSLDNYTRIVPPNAQPSDFPGNAYRIVDCGGIKLAVHKEFECGDKKYTGWHGPGYGHRKQSCELGHPQDAYSMPKNREQALESLAAIGNQKFGRRRLGESFYQALVLHQVPGEMLAQFNIEAPEL